VEEKVAMFLLVVGHGLKMRLLRGQYKRSLGTISAHFSEVLRVDLVGTGKRMSYNLRVTKCGKDMWRYETCHN
jgi:hypothetical protein